MKQHAPLATRLAVRVRRALDVHSTTDTSTIFDSGAVVNIETRRGPLVNKTGDLCVHSGWMLHGARAISKGVRYVLIGFCNIDAFWLNKDAKRPYYQYTEDRTVLRSVIKPEFL